MNRMSRTSAKVVLPSELEVSSVPQTVAAPRFARMGAFLIDFFVMVPFMALLSPLAFVYSAGYGSVFGPGRSLGRKAVRQQLTGKDGEPVTHTQAMARGLLRTIMWMFVLPFFIDLVLFAIDGRLLVDRIFGTKVTLTPEEARRQLSHRATSARDAITEKVVEEADRWDERFEQEELDEIAGELGYGHEGFEDKELDDFERRLSKSSHQASLVPVDTLDVPPVELEDLFAPSLAEEEANIEVQDHR